MTGSQSNPLSASKIRQFPGDSRLIIETVPIMRVQFIRPDAFQLAFHLYERAIHPELFKTFGEAVIATVDFQARLRICEAGHMLQITSHGRTITEVTGPRDQVLPKRGLSCGHRLAGGRDWSFQLPGMHYHYSAHVEAVDPEVFSSLHNELEHDSHRAFLSKVFPAPHRLQAGALSVLQVEGTPRSLLVHAFHTFPNNNAILRTQSLLEL